MLACVGGPRAPSCGCVRPAASKDDPVETHSAGGPQDDGSGFFPITRLAPVIFVGRPIPGRSGALSGRPGRGVWWGPVLAAAHGALAHLGARSVRMGKEINWKAKRRTTTFEPGQGLAAPQEYQGAPRRANKTTFSPTLRGGGRGWSTDSRLPLETMASSTLQSRCKCDFPSARAAQRDKGGCGEERMARANHRRAPAGRRAADEDVTRGGGGPDRSARRRREGV